MRQSGSASALGAGVLCLWLLGSLPAVAGELRVTWVPAAPRPGDAVLVRVTGVPEGAALAGSLAGRPLAFFRHAAGHAALGGLDLDAPAGAPEWRIEAVQPGEPPRAASGRLQVSARSFAVQRLTLPPSLVDLDPATERRAAEETARLRAVYATVTPERLWRGAFARPLAGEGPGKGFGARRVINDRPRAPHAGTDYAGPAGSPVGAANAGRVALVGEFFFPGRFVVLDHGLGLHTLYFHLDTVAVSEGERLERGQPLGTVGSTGRSTGPHLHFGVQLGPARLDPATLLELAPPE